VIPLPIRKPPGRTSIAARCCASAWARSRRKHRTIIDLVYYHEKSVQEVAAIVGIPCATVKTRMFYARKKLSALLATQGLTRAAAM
jgi:RNA polymerase sigma-70 factor (ECF subfamily)